MIGIAVNVLAVILGGLLGTVLGPRMSPQFTAQLNKVFGLCAMAMGISSIVLMTSIPAVVLALIAGTVIGLVCHLNELITKGGQQMERAISRVMKSANSSLPREEYLSFLTTAIVLFCTGATGIYGSLDAGMTGDVTILLARSIQDFFTALVFACTLGTVVSVIAVPQFIVFSLLFLLARIIYPLTTPTMINDFKACGGVILTATGFRVAKMGDFPVADMIPAMVLVMPLSSLWVNVILPLL